MKFNRIVCAALFLMSAGSSMASPKNVDTSKDDKTRAKQIKAIVDHVVADLDQGGAASYKLAVTRFLTRVAWHEGAACKHRKQNGGGPGRSFFQFEPAKAKDGVDYAITKKWIDRLSKAGSTTDSALKKSAAALKLGAPWPAGSLIESKLLASDEFGAYLARIALKRIPSSIPSGLDDQTKYWAKHWKVKFASAADKKKKMAQFKANAQVVDKLLGW